MYTLGTWSHTMYQRVHFFTLEKSYELAVYPFYMALIIILDLQLQIFSKVKIIAEFVHSVWPLHECDKAN
jgi:hypothetical protein